MSLSYQLFNQEKAPLLILLHGAGFDQSMWHSCIQHLPNYAIACVDLPGHGQSAKQKFQSIEHCAIALSELIRELQHDKISIHLCGISLGGYVALRMAFLFPQLCHSLYISGIHINKVENTWPIALMAALSSPFATTRFMRKKSQKSMGIPDGSEFANWSKPAVCNASTLRKVTNAVLHFSMPEDELRQVTSRLLITAGSKEHAAILKSVETIKLYAVNCQSMIVEGAGHAWPAEQPQYFIETLTRWLNRYQSINNQTR